LGYPIANEYAPGAYLCRSGDVFIKGELKGDVTVAAENNVYVVDDVRYKRDAAGDPLGMLGLVGQNAVYVWNPVWRDTSDRFTRWHCLTAACKAVWYNEGEILSVAHTYTGENLDRNMGYQGTLTLNGSLAQKFRGIVRYQSGYDKDYRYDKRFRYTAPPKF